MGQALFAAQEIEYFQDGQAQKAKAEGLSQDGDIGYRDKTQRGPDKQKENDPHDHLSFQGVKRVEQH
jgi:hypothetical protein